MPNIRTFENPVEAPHPTEMGSSAYQMAGRRIAIGFDEFGQNIENIGRAVQEHDTRMETAKAAADLATAHAQLTTQWNRLANSTDPNQIEQAQANFQEKVVKPTLDKIGEGLNTTGAKDYFARASATIGGDWMEKSSADVMHIQGVAAVNNAVTMQNQLSNLLTGDPTSFDKVLQLSDQAISAIKGQGVLPAGKEEEIKQQFHEGYAKAAMQGMINSNPQQAAQDIADGRFDKYVGADITQAYVKRAQEAVKAQQTDQRAQEAEQRRQNKAAVDQQANAVLARMVQPDGSLAPASGAAKAITQLAFMPDAEPGLIKSMADMNDRLLKESKDGVKAVTDPNTYSSFSQRMLLPTGDPHALTDRDIFSARANGMLSDKDFTFFREAVGNLNKDPAKKLAYEQFDQFTKGMKASITKSNPMMNMFDGPGDQRFYNFQFTARQMFDQGLAKGLSPAQMLDPGSKDYLGKIVPKFAFSQSQLQGMMDSRVRSMTGGNIYVAPPVSAGGAPKRNPGESAADFLKRTGG